MSESHAGLKAVRHPGSGRSRRKVLIIGDHRLVSLEVGDGPATVTVSKALAVHGQRPTGGIDVDVLTDLLPAMRAITSSAVSWRHWHYDTAIVVLGSHPPQGHAAAAPIEPAVLDGLAALAHASALIVVVLAPATTVPTTPGRRSRRLERQLTERSGAIQTVTARINEYGRIEDPVDVADTLLHILDDPSTATTSLERRIGPRTEQEHRHATSRSLQTLGGITPDLLRVAALARNTFDTPYAQVNVVSGGELHSLAHAGHSSDVQLGALSAMVIRRNTALLIEDTLADTRCRWFDTTPGIDTIRFYAGHPITAEDGHQIGTLSVFDTTPHPVEQEDDLLLRDLAILAEAEINALTR